MTTTELPIMFKGELVRAILEGRKTQTRRLCKPAFDKSAWAAAVYPDGAGTGWIAWWGPGPFSPQQTAKLYPGAFGFRCPYGLPGDRLWVRETFQAWPSGVSEYDDSGPLSTEEMREGAPANFEYQAGPTESLGPWRPSIHMPRRASRIDLDITGVRVERLQDITEAGALAEGMRKITKDGGRTWKFGWPDCDGLPGTDDDGQPWVSWSQDYRIPFARKCDSINGAGAWDSNPWVWVIEFKPIAKGCP